MAKKTAKKDTTKKLLVWDWNNKANEQVLHNNAGDSSASSLFKNMKELEANLKTVCLDNNEDGTAYVYEITITPVKQIKVIRNDIKLEEVK